MAGIIDDGGGHGAVGTSDSTNQKRLISLGFPVPTNQETVAIGITHVPFGGQSTRSMVYFQQSRLGLTLTLFQGFHQQVLHMAQKPGDQITTLLLRRRGRKMHRAVGVGKSQNHPVRGKARATSGAEQDDALDGRTSPYAEIHRDQGQGGGFPGGILKSDCGERKRAVNSVPHIRCRRPPLPGINTRRRLQLPATNSHATLESGMVKGWWLHGVAASAALRMIFTCSLCHNARSVETRPRHCHCGWIPRSKDAPATKQWRHEHQFPADAPPGWPGRTPAK